MTRGAWTALAVGVVAAAALVIAWAVVGANLDNGQPPPDVIDSDPQPTAVPDTDPELPGDDSDAHNDEGDHAEVIDLTNQYAAAAAAASAWVTFDLKEPAETRTRRLAPLFADGAALAGYPEAARADLWMNEGIDVTVSVDSIDLISPSGPTPDGNGYALSVFVSITAHYSQTGQPPQTFKDRREIVVWTPADGDPRPTAITER